VLAEETEEAVPLEGGFEVNLNMELTWLLDSDTCMFTGIKFSGYFFTYSTLG